MLVSFSVTDNDLKFDLVMIILEYSKLFYKHIAVHQM